MADSPALDSTPTRLSAPAKADSEPHACSPPHAERERQAWRERRLARYQVVCDLHRQGGSIRAIARHVTLDRLTVRHLLLAEGFPERMARPPIPSL